MLKNFYVINKHERLVVLKDGTQFIGHRPNYWWTFNHESTLETTYIVSTPITSGLAIGDIFKCGDFSISYIVLK